MKFSYNWIREFVDGLDTPAQALERLITMKTAECEGVENTGSLLAEAAIARIESVEPIEGSHNMRAIVDTERYGRKQVVCGAQNCRPGVLTVYVPIGIKEIAGVTSDGMLASATELDISRDHSGIIELNEPQQLPDPDSIIEIDNKSITHRPDLWGHFGMAREVAAITNKPLRDPVRLDLLPPPGGPVQVEIEDLSLCPRYSALVFENVTVAPSPLWLQYRLTAVGLNPINNIVDLTNYIMAEIGQPMHAFDRARLTGTTIWARPARQGEKIAALNDETYDLSPSNLVIADAAGPVALAGVIGGAASAISETTTSIVFESANFSASSIRRTSAALKLRTDASIRFEKSQDPHNTVRALARAVQLIPLVSPGARLASGLADLSRELGSPEPVLLSLDLLARRLGRVVESAEVRSILESLEFHVEEINPNLFSVRIPSWRATKDIGIPDDLVEEVGRMLGYDSIEPRPPLVPCAPSFDPPQREFLRGIKRVIAAQGFTEASNYSFISEEEARRFSFAAGDHLKVLNPIAEGQELLRASLLPGIYRNIVENAKHFDTFRVFEIGREIHKRDGALPDERTHLMAASFSKDDDSKDNGRTQLLELKRTVECIAPGAHVRMATPLAWQHPARCAEVWWNGRQIGRLSELHPDLIESGRAAVADIDLDLLRELTPSHAVYSPVRRFPTSAFDLSIVAGARALAGDLELEIRRRSDDLVLAVEYVREYQGAPLPPDKKSVSFRVIAGAPDRTLSSDQIADIRNRIITGLNESGYELRL